MILVLTVLEIVAPIAILGAIGYLWVRFGFEFRLEFVTRLSMTLGVPALIFTALMQSTLEPQALAALSLAALAAYAALALLFWALLRGFGLSQRTYLAPLIFGNTGNLGLPLALFAFGETGLSQAVVVFAVMAILSFTFGLWLVAGGGAPWKALREPVVGATLLGALFLAMGWQTPLWLTHSLELVGQMAIPLMLITLGVAMARIHPGQITRAFWLSALRAVLCSGVAYGTGLGFGLEGPALAVLVLQIATPVAVTSYMMAEKYGAEAGEVAGLVILSTLMSVLTLPLTLAFFL